MVSRATVVWLALALAALCLALRMTGGAGVAKEGSSAFLPDAGRGPVSVSVSRDGEAPTTLFRNGGAWMFAPPFAGSADSAAVESMLAAFSGAAVRDRVSPRQRKVRGLELSDYGLDSPRASVSFALAGRPAQSVSFGCDAPGGGVFALASDGADVLVVGRETLESVPSGGDALRSRSLLDGEPGSASVLELRRSGEPPLRLEREGEAGPWRIVSPFAFPADSGAVNALVARLSGPSIRRFVRTPGTNDTAAAAAAARLAHGLAPEEIEASVAVWRRGAAAPETLVFGAGDPSDPGSVFASSLASGIVCTVGEAVAAAAATPLSELRDRRVFPFGIDDVVAFRVGGPGRTEAALARASGGWRFTLPAQAPADSFAVERFLSEPLSWRDAAAAPADSGTCVRPDLSPDSEIDVSFTLRDSAEPRLATIRRGSPEGASPAWTVRRSEDGAPLVLLDHRADPAEAFSAAAVAAMRDRTVLRLPPGSVVRISAAGADGTPLAIDEPDLRAVAALATNLVAETVLSASSSEFAAWGLLPPRVQWCVETSLPERPVAILQLGALRPDGTACLRLKGDAAVFAVSAADAALLSAGEPPDDFPKTETPENQK